MKKIIPCLSLLICTIFFLQLQNHATENIVAVSASPSEPIVYLPVVTQPQSAGASLVFSSVTSPTEIGKYQRFEINFQLDGLTDQNLQLPYLSTSESNEFTQSFVDKGVSVDAIFIGPAGKEYRQPAFWFEDYNADLAPTGLGSWQVRFSPHQTGGWSYRLAVASRDGIEQSELYRFNVTDSAEPGFVRVAENDTRYFELDNGDFYSNIGFNYSIKELDNAETVAGFGANGVNYVRTWITRLNITGGAWSHLSMKPTIYDGYLPRDGIIPYTPLGKETPEFWLRVSQQHDWYRSCLYTNQEYDQIAVKPNTDYLVQTEFESYGVVPADGSKPYGFTIMIDGWVDRCDQLDASTAVTTHPNDQNEQNVTAEGVWNSGERKTIPFVYLALDNASAGDAYIKSVSIKEKLPNGELGPELFVEPLADKRSYYSQRESAILDQIVTNAETHDVYLRLVIGEKEDPLFLRTDPFGMPTSSDRARFYGDGRTIQYNRYVQMAWWRYVQARWGYSSAIHSWELINEGDPFDGNHYALADEFGKFMKCGVFGISASGTCDNDHPNAHMVSTSFWHSFPAEQFWNNGAYPNIDFADIHKYLPATDPDPHQDLAKAVLNLTQTTSGVSKPVVRGETGLVDSGTSGAVSALRNDGNPVWLHNILWASLNGSGVLESGYWYVREHIVNDEFSLLNHFKEFADFTNQLPLNNGHYQPINGSFSQDQFVLVGQIDAQNRQAHGWLRHPDFTWKSVEDGQNLFGVDGNLLIQGFEPDQSYVVTLKAFGVSSGYVETERTVNANGAGSFVLDLAFSGDVGSVAFKIRPVQAFNPAVEVQVELEPHVGQDLASMGIDCLLEG